MDCVRIVKALSESLGLSHPPIGMAFLNEVPAGVERYSQVVPSACAFWKAAQTAFFYATAEDHYNCPIGAITQGFHPPQHVMQEGMQLIGQMGKIQYFEAAEAQNVPAVEKPHQVIVYGPLKDFQQISPDVAMAVCTPFQAMLLSEAAGTITWRGAGREARVFGRPACAVIPSALKESATSASLGCMGARTFAGIQENELLVAIPAAQLPEAGRKLSIILSANSEMRKFYQGRQSQFAQG